MSSFGAADIYHLLSTDADRQGVDISVTVFLFLFFSVRLRISPARIKLAASNFARWFRGLLGRECPIWGTLLPQKARSPKSDESARGGATRARPRHVWITVSPLHWRYLLNDYLSTLAVHQSDCLARVNCTSLSLWCTPCSLHRCSFQRLEQQLWSYGNVTAQSTESLV